MNISVKRGGHFLKEFREFLSFLKQLWGILTGISIFSPLSNIFIYVIPLQSIEYDGAFVRLSPSFITSITTLVTLFVILSIFNSRGNFKGNKHKAIVSFLIGILSLLFYVVLYEIKISAFDLWGWESDDPLHLLAELPLLLGYVAFFSLTTRAFMFLGLLEFYKQDDKIT